MWVQSTFDKAAKQEHELRKATIELEERRRQELELARELEKREEDQILVEEQFESLQDEVDAKSRKLKKVWNKYQSMKSMLEDTESDLNRAREDAGNIIRDLKRQNKLKQLIVDYFIPPDIVELISRKAQWDEASDEYILMQKLGRECNERPASGISNRSQAPREPVCQAPEKV